MATAVELIVFGVVGLFGTNAIPHFVRGITGERHMTPFGSESMRGPERPLGECERHRRWRAGVAVP